MHVTTHMNAGLDCGVWQSTNEAFNSPFFKKKKKKESSHTHIHAHRKAHYMGFGRVLHWYGKTQGGPGRGSSKKFEILCGSKKKVEILGGQLPPPPPKKILQFLLSFITGQNPRSY